MSNRPIKLRAWDADSRTFVPVVSLLLPESRPVVQFTGVHDANGLEIWEGDILCWRQIDEAGQVSDVDDSMGPGLGRTHIVGFKAIDTQLQTVVNSQTPWTPFKH